MPKEFLLVHGACHGAWCWEEVVGRLRARGHRVAALDLPGHGRRASEVRRASIASYAAAVADALAAEGMSRAIVATRARRRGRDGWATCRGAIRASRGRSPC